jgi:nucleoside-diphosphate-sugar epimerase
MYSPTLFPPFSLCWAKKSYTNNIQAHKKAILAAQKSGVKHIFYSSLGFAGNETNNTSVAHVMGAHLLTEKFLAELPGTTTYTVVREGLYSESFPIYTNWFDLRNPANEITIPHDGSGPGVAWVKRDELGEATAKLVARYATATGGNPAVVEEFPFVNRIVLLTGPRVYSLSETVEILGRVVGRDVRIKPVTVDEYAAFDHKGLHTYHGVNLAREWATAWEAIRRGETAVVTPTLKEILGREPEDYEATIRELLV